MLIKEVQNDLPNIKPVKEIMNVYISGIDPNLPNRNGFIYALIGAPGTGKSRHYCCRFLETKIIIRKSLITYT
jgi:hypothetical protein